MTPIRRTIAITGASAGLGRVVARRLAADGHRLALIARGRAGLRAAAAEVERAGGTSLVVPCDVADAAAVERAVDRIEAELGPIDVWISCAMTAVQAPVLETTAAELRRVTEVTYLGAAHGIVAAVRRMLPRDHGHVLQIGSSLAYHGTPLQAGYSGAKHAIRGFCDALRAELEHDGSAVRITLLHPPGMNTTHFGWVRARTAGEPRPVPPVVQPEAVAETVAWAIEHPRRERIVLDAATALAIPLGRFDLPLVGPLAARAVVRGLQRRTPLGVRPDALGAPLDDERDHGVRGPLGREVRQRVPEAALLRRGTPTVVAAAVATGAVLVTALRVASLTGRRRSPRRAGRRPDARRAVSSRAACDAARSGTGGA